MTATTTHFDTVHVDELRLLEAEAVHVIREVVAELERPVLLFSAGKDSIVLLRLAEKAFRPGPLPFPVMHVDTGHNFDEVIEFRDRRVTGQGHKLIVASVQESIDSGRVPDPGPGASRNRQQTRTLLDALEAGGFDAAFGGARRDEERARAKERILSFRDEFGQWDPRAQRPEPWSLYNGRIKKGEQVRVFPLSNWTELDVWRCIELENLELPSIYFAHAREVFERDGILLAVSEYGHLTRFFADAGVVALASLVSPLKSDREIARALNNAAKLPFIEVYVATPREECEKRDPKGLYARARAGELKGLTGVDAPYEPPESPDLVLDTTGADIDQLVAQVIDLLNQKRQVT